MSIRFGAPIRRNVMFLLRTLRTGTESGVLNFLGVLRGLLPHSLQQSAIRLDEFSNVTPLGHGRNGTLGSGVNSKISTVEIPENTQPSFLSEDKHSGIPKRISIFSQSNKSQ